MNSFRVKKREFEKYINLYIESLIKSLELSIKQNKVYFKVCQELGKKSTWSKTEIARLFDIPNRYILQWLANIGIFNKGEQIGFLEKFHLAHEVPGGRGRVIAVTDIGRIISDVLRITGENLSLAQKLFRQKIKYSEDLLNDICIQGVIFYNYTKKMLPNLPRNFIERDLFEFFVPKYRYNDGKPVKEIPPLTLRNIQLEESGIASSRECKIEIYFEATPSLEYVDLIGAIEMNEIRYALEFKFLQIIPYIKSIYYDEISKKLDIDISRSEIDEFFDDYSYCELTIELGNNDIIKAYFIVTYPSIRRCEKWLGL
ncbi:hypothetical protein DRP04_05245 [Archaeoglobales archaeon]|nr:MAG: hypothetical protein DRP04_05245 [Archaeoglobales archaeon]